MDHHFHCPVSVADHVCHIKWVINENSVTFPTMGVHTDFFAVIMLSERTALVSFTGSQTELFFPVFYLVKLPYLSALHRKVLGSYGNDRVARSKLILVFQYCELPFSPSIYFLY